MQKECYKLAIDAFCSTHRWTPGFTSRAASFLSNARSTPDSSTNVTNTILLAVGLLPVADVLTAARSTITTGTPSLLDALVICAGIHKDSQAPSLSNGEYPACAAMTSDYVFRVENEATVQYMQRIGRTGQLTTLRVERQHKRSFRLDSLWCSTATILCLAYLCHRADWYGTAMICSYIAVRLVNVLVLRNRAMPGWKGKAEPGVLSDLLVLLSQDRWIRLQGLTDDVKLVTSGEWLRQCTLVERLATTISTLVLYLSAGLVLAVTNEARLCLLCLVSFTTITMEVASYTRNDLELHGRVIRITGPRKLYERRLDMAEELIGEVGRDQWCEKMGIILRSRHLQPGTSAGPAHM